MAVKFSNNGKTTLSAGITSSATSISVTDGSVFPTLGSGDSFYMTLEDSSGNNEIVSVTAVSTNTLTVTRAQEGTTARAFSSGDKAENRLTAAGLNSFVSDSGDTITGNLEISVEGSGATNVLKLTTTGEGTVPSILFEGDQGGTQHVAARIRAGQEDASNGNIIFEVEDAGSLGEAVRIRSNGSVGIGNSSAQTRLFVGDGSGTEGITIYSGTTGEGQLRFADGTTGSALYQGRIEYNHSTNKLFLGAGGTTPIAIDSNGNLGIGTSSPSGLMSFAKGSRTLDLKLEDSPATGDSGVQLRAGSGDYFGIAAGGGTGVGIVLDDSNNVGIGTSSPTTALDVSGAVNITSGTSIGLTINADDFGEALKIVRNHADNAPSITLENSSGRVGILYATASDDTLRWRPGTTSESNEIWHAGNDGSGSGLDADTLDGVQGASYLRSDATDTTTGYFSVDNHFRVVNNGVTGQGDNHTHFNYQDNGTNYIRGTNTIVSSPLSAASTVTSTGGSIRVGDSTYQMALSTDGTGSSASIGTNLSNEVGLFWHTSTDYAIYRTAGAWTASTYQQLKLDWPTGIILKTSARGTYSYSYTRVDGSLTVDDDVRTPLLYDSDDTAYYIDPAGSGYGLNLGTAIHMNNHEINYVQQLHFNDNVRFYDDGNDSYLNFKFGDATAGGIKMINSSDELCGRLYANSDQNVGFLDNDGHWAVRIQTGTDPLQLRCNNNVELEVYTAYALAPGSMRAPIFYDSNNTAYYTNPAGTSYVQYLGRKSHSTGHLVGGHNNIGSTATYSNPIYTIGSSYNPSGTTLSNMYGIGYTHTNATFIGFAGSSGWGMYVASDGDARVYLSGQQGHGYFTGNVTAYASDQRLKTNVKTIDNALDKVTRIRGVEFDWVDNISSEYDFHPQQMHETGVLAQEIQEVVPDAVVEAPMNANYTAKSGVENNFLTVDKEKIIPLLIEAIKELKAELDALKGASDV